MFKLCITGDLGFEFWKDIPGYEGLYQASTYGRVRSRNRILTPWVNKGGYLSVTLKGKNVRVHRLIAIVFLPNFNNYPSVNHKSEIKSENQVWNLEYCTVKYNTNFGTRNERISLAHLNNKKQSKTVIQRDLQGTIVSTYPSAAEAARITGLSRGNISNCCRGIYKQAYGFLWSYAE